MAVADVIVRATLGPGAPIPAYATEGAAGLDLVAAHGARVRAGEVTVVQTGLCIALPPGYEAQVRSRSGLAKLGVVVVNQPGTIDADYRGEVCVMLTMLRWENAFGRWEPMSYGVVQGDRIAQLVIAPVARAELMVVKELPPSVRGTRGFGSTGR